MNWVNASRSLRWKKISEAKYYCSSLRFDHHPTLTSREQKVVERGLAMEFLAYLGNEEVHVLLHEDLQLLLEYLFDIYFTLAAKVWWCLTHTSRHQSVSFIRHLPRNVTGCFIDLLTLGWGVKDTSQLTREVEKNYAHLSIYTFKIIALHPRKQGLCRSMVYGA